MKTLYKLSGKLILLVLLSSLTFAQQPAPQRRSTPRLTTEDVQMGKSGSLTSEDKTEPYVPPDQAEKATSETFNAHNLIKSSFSKLNTMDSLRCRMKFIGAPQGDAELTIETVKPNRSHIQSQTGEVIVIGSKFYFREGNSAWKIANTPLPKQEVDPQQMLNSLFSTPNLKLQGKILGKATIDNVSTILYEITETRAGTTDTESILIWIGEADQVPRKIKISRTNSPLELTMWYSSFNSVVINPPN